MKIFLTTFFTFFILLTNRSVQAEVSVAFFKYALNGQEQQLGINAEFYHTAILVDGKWVSADILTGVTISDHLPTKYELIATITIDNLHIPIESITHYSKKRFNLFAVWKNPFETNCSNMVGEILELIPTPMSFDQKLYPGRKLPNGELGISPDKIFEQLSNSRIYNTTIRRYQKTSSKACVDYLTENDFLLD